MADSAAQGGQIKELKASAHTMSLDPGLYCVFNAPGSSVSPNGLPGVRITVGPSRTGQVSVAAFNADGWVGVDEGALVRVAEGVADVLVTVYQANDSKADAPKLQVVRLSAEPGATPQPVPAAVAAPQQAPARKGRQVSAPDGVEVMAHVYGRGDVGAPLGTWMGEPGSQRWIEGFGIAPVEGIPLGDIEYQAVLGRGWLSPWSEGGQFCGSRGMSLPILGLRVRLRGESAKTHRVELSASFVDGSKIGPVGDGAACEAPSLAALEAFHVVFVPAERAEAAAAPAGKARAAEPAKAPAKGSPRKAKAASPPPPAPPTGKRKGKAAPPATPAPAAPAPAAPAKGRRAGAASRR